MKIYFLWLGAFFYIFSNHSVQAETVGETALSSKPINEEIILNHDFQTALNAYFMVKNALVNSDPKAASKNALDLKLCMERIDVKQENKQELQLVRTIIKDALHISEQTDLEMQRSYFVSLSDNMYNLAKTQKLQKPIYYQHCPMANKGQGANWLSDENAVKNPYYGASMLNCGKTIETIK